MTMLRKMMAPAFLATTLLVSSLALAVDPAKAPSGKVEIDETQFGLIVGGSTGGGTLTYHGKKHDFKVGGLSVGAAIGAAKISAVGEVYDLTDLSKFPGTYTKLDANVALGGGVGGVQMKNENGVIMRLDSTTQGLQFNLGVSGVKVTMEK
ncbi:MAG: DUF1134 domain-containing protein [Candidatus Competibacter denitrificans]